MKFLKKLWARLTGGPPSIDLNTVNFGGTGQYPSQQDERPK